MRKPLTCDNNSNNHNSNSPTYNNNKIEDMSSSAGVSNFDVVVGVESRVDRVRKILSSPLNKKKSSSSSSSSSSSTVSIVSNASGVDQQRLTFGVPLENQRQLRTKSDGECGLLVPFIVHRICDYIECNGFHHEGLFRVSGSIRTMDKLRASFDSNGDAELEETADVMAAAGLLKQFLRSLPEPVIPIDLHTKFIKVQQDRCHTSNEEFIRQLKRLVEQLPEPNFNLLKYLMGLLVKVSAAEQYNRMNANSLGIVFGPSLFRVSDVAGVEGLREQSIANQIVTKFVHDYSAIFEVDTAAPILSSSVSVSSSCTSSSMTTAIVTHKKFDVATTLAFSSCTAEQSNSVVPKLDTPKTTVPPTGTTLTFSSVLDGLKAVPIENNRNKIIEMSISDAVTRNLLEADKLRPPLRLKHKKLELSPDGAAHNKLARSNSEERSTSDKQRQQQHHCHHADGSSKTSTIRGFDVGLAIVRKCSSHEDVLDSGKLTSIVDNKSKENKPIDAGVLQKSESGQSQAMTPLNVDTSTQAIPDLRKSDWGRHNDGEGDCSEARRSMERLQNFSQFQRSTVTSKVRRPATLKSSRRCASMEVVRNDDADDDSLKENIVGCRSTSCSDQGRLTKPFQKRSSSLTLVESPTTVTMASSATSVDDDPMNDELEEAAQMKEKGTNEVDLWKPRLWLLDLHDATPVDHQDDQRTSPNATTHKPYVPPLDLATLHEHGDGSDPIPTNQLRASWPFIHNQQAMYDEVMLSPRTNSLEKMSSAFVDSNIPPSPPSVQEISRKSASFKDVEEREASFRILNKKVSSLKRKIKQYEDGFEDEYGYRPSHAEKMSQSEVKRYMTELAKIRKELKQLKEEARLVTMANSFSLSGNQVGNGGVSGSGLPPSDVNMNGKYGKTPTMQSSLDEMMRKVSAKRRTANRPEALEDMSGEEVLEEKLVIQKALLYFENIHGRPVTKQEKELMKPIYDRYRSVKRLAAKASSPKMKDPTMELQPILEHETMDFTQASPKHQRFPPNDNGIEDGVSVFKAAVDGDIVVSVGVDTDIKVATNDCQQNVDGEEARATIYNDPEIRTAKRKLQEDSCNLHELSHKELLEQEWKVRSEKKRLRRILREFEEGFQRQTGRKAQREDRAPIDSVYLEYKQVKAKLKLLEALLTKHEYHYTI